MNIKLFSIVLGFGSFLFPAEGLVSMTWNVDGAVREALVYIPDEAKKSARPVVFVFHGHFGTSKWAADSFGIEKLWPEAIVVYMQGLKTPGKLTDPEGKGNGWQGTIGEQ
ncbi:MAG: esterase, partial [Spirochaetia bacterium]|nr:esterase [Spirochaetia bacterium]